MLAHMRARITPILFVALLCISAQAQQAVTAPVVITMVDPSGAPVPGTKIRVIPAPDPLPKMETDSKGQLALNLRPGGYALFAGAQGFKPVAMHFDVRTQTEPQMVRAVFQIAQGGGVMVSPAQSKDDLVFYAYPYHDPAAFTPAQIKAMPHINVTVHNPHAKTDETYSGVRLSDLLAKLGAPLGRELHGGALANYVVALGSDGYEAVLSLAEVDPEFHSGEVVVADEMNGKPLDEHNGPLKLVVTEDKRPARCVRNLTTIDLRSAQ